MRHEILIRFFHDGDGWCAAYSHFIDIPCPHFIDIPCPIGFGENPITALLDLQSKDNRFKKQTSEEQK